MSLRNRFKEFAPVILLFIIVNSLAISLRARWQAWNVNQDVLILGNLFLFAVTSVSFFMAKRGLKSTNPHAFVRAVYGSIMFKLFLCLIVAFIYISVYKKELNKPAFFGCMGLYLLYTFLEVSALTRLLRRQPNA